MKRHNEKTNYHILVIGGNGGVGRQCIQLALDRGLHVTAVLRTPSKLQLSHPRLEIVQGDITAPNTFSQHFEHKDAVISALGVSSGFGADRPTTLYSQGAATILEQMKKAGTARAFFISASAIEISPVIPFFIRLMAKYVVQKLLKHMYADLRKMEALVKASNMDWTIIRPPQLTNRPETGNYRVAINTFLKNCLKISRADLAHFMIEHIDDQLTYRTTVEISY